MPLKTFECLSCNHLDDHVLGMNENKPKSPCRKCGEADPEKFDRKYTKAPAMRNDSVRNPGGLKDWRIGKTVEQMASVYLDEADPY